MDHSGVIEWTHIEKEGAMGKLADGVGSIGDFFSTSPMMQQGTNYVCISSAIM